MEELLVFSEGEGEGEASALLVEDFFLVVVDAEAPPSELFFLVVDAEVEVLVVPDFFAAVVVVDFLPVVVPLLVALVVDVVEAADSFL